MKEVEEVEEVLRPLKHTVNKDSYRNRDPHSADNIRTSALSWVYGFMQEK